MRLPSSLCLNKYLQLPLPSLSLTASLMHSQCISWHLHPATSHLIAHQKAIPPSVGLLHNCWQDNTDSCWELTGLSGWLNTTCCWSAIPQVWPVNVKAFLTWDSAQFLFGLLAIYHLDKNIFLLVPLLYHSLKKTAAFLTVNIHELSCAALHSWRHWNSGAGVWALQEPGDGIKPIIYQSEPSAGSGLVLVLIQSRFNMWTFYVPVSFSTEMRATAESHHSVTGCVSSFPVFLENNLHWLCDCWSWLCAPTVTSKHDWSSGDCSFDRWK